LTVDKDRFEQAAIAFRGMTDEQQKEYLASLDPTEALMIQGAAAG
jgi:hypothetical protein